MVTLEFDAPIEALRLAGLQPSTGSDSMLGTITGAAGSISVSSGETRLRTVNGVGQAFSATRLSGSAVALNQYLAHDGNVFFDTSAGNTLGLRIVGAVSSRGEIAIDTSPVADAAVVQPSLRLPEFFTLPTDGALRLPAQAIGGEGLLSVTLEVSAGTLQWQASTLVQADASGAVLAVGSGSTLTLVGDAAMLSDWLSAPDSLRWAASGDASLSVQVRSLDPLAPSGTVLRAAQSQSQWRQTQVSRSGSAGGSASACKPGSR